MAYKVLPFIANIRVGQGPDVAASQLSFLINQEDIAGWRYVRMENVEINIHNPGSKGCLGLGCFGVVPPSNERIRYDMVVFDMKG